MHLGMSFWLIKLRQAMSSYVTLCKATTAVIVAENTWCTQAPLVATITLRLNIFGYFWMR